MSSNSNESKSKHSRRCQVTGKTPLFGNKVSHSHHKTRMSQAPNIQKRRFWSPMLDRWVRLTVSTSGIRNIDRLGIDVVLKKLRSEGQRF